MARRQIGAALAAMALAGLVYAATWLQPAQAVPVASERVTQEITLQALGGTAVQMDMCSSAQAARISAGRLLDRGSAGFVHFDGGYRVLGTLLNTRGEAETMCERFNKDGLAAQCYDCGGSALTLKVSGEARHIEALANAIHAVDMAAVQPVQIADQLDGAQIDCDRARALMAMLVSDLETAQADFRDTGAEGALSEALDGLMSEALAWLEPLAQERGQSRLAMSGEIRCAGMAILLRREEMICRLGQR